MPRGYQAISFYPSPRGSQDEGLQSRRQSDAAIVSPGAISAGAFFGRSLFQVQACDQVRSSVGRPREWAVLDSAARGLRQGLRKDECSSKRYEMLEHSCLTALENLCYNVVNQSISENLNLWKLNRCRVKKPGRENPHDDNPF